MKLKMFPSLMVAQATDAVNAADDIKGTISAVLAEAEVDPHTLETTFVENGGCFEIESATFDTM